MKNLAGSLVTIMGIVSALQTPNRAIASVPPDLPADASACLCLGAIAVGEGDIVGRPAPLHLEVDVIAVHGAPVVDVGELAVLAVRQDSHRGLGASYLNNKPGDLELHRRALLQVQPNADTEELEIIATLPLAAAGDTVICRGEFSENQWAEHNVPVDEAISRAIRPVHACMASHDNQGGCLCRGADAVVRGELVALEESPRGEDYRELEVRATEVSGEASGLAVYDELSVVEQANRLPAGIAPGDEIYLQLETEPDSPALLGVLLAADSAGVSAVCREAGREIAVEPQYGRNVAVPYTLHDVGVCHARTAFEEGEIGWSCSVAPPSSDRYAVGAGHAALVLVAFGLCLRLRRPGPS